MRMITTGISGLVLLVATEAGHAQETDIKDEIISRCRETMGDYGAHMVKFCVEQDLDAAIALGAYPESAHDIMRRCIGQMGDYGWHMVKFCVDQDIEAERALQELERAD